VWLNAGQPSAGTLHHIKCSVKARYKVAIRDAYVIYKEKHFDCLMERFLNKKVPGFWKCWNVKYRKNVSKQVIINGYSNDVDIGNEFANHFSSVYASSSSDNTTRIMVDEQNNYHITAHKFDSDMPNLVTAELIKVCVNNLELGKACGPDDQGDEHLHYAHLLLYVHLKFLFT
jgi:hypothetical protein